jgi:hypothetical protein
VGVVDQEVEPAPRVDGALHQPGDLRLLDHVGVLVDGLAARGQDLIDDGRAEGIVHVGDDDTVAARGGETGDFGTDALGRPGNCGD